MHRLWAATASGEALLTAFRSPASGSTCQATERTRLPWKRGHEPCSSHGVLNHRRGVGAPCCRTKTTVAFQVGQAWSAGGDSTGGNQVPSLRFACVVGLSNAAPHGPRKGFCEGRGVEVQATSWAHSARPRRTKWPSLTVQAAARRHARTHARPAGPSSPCASRSDGARTPQALGPLVMVRAWPDVGPALYAPPSPAVLQGSGWVNHRQPWLRPPACVSRDRRSHPSGSLRSGLTGAAHPLSPDIRQATTGRRTLPPPLRGGGGLREAPWHPSYLLNGESKRKASNVDIDSHHRICVCRATSTRSRAGSHVCQHGSRGRAPDAVSLYVAGDTTQNFVGLAPALPAPQIGRPIGSAWAHGGPATKPKRHRSPNVSRVARPLISGAQCNGRLYFSWLTNTAQK